MKILKVLPLFIVAILFFNTNGNAQAQRAQLEQVNVNDVADLLTAGAMMIDVREVSEVEAIAYDVEGIINIPLSEFESRIGEIPTDRKLIIVCRSGNRSTRASHLLMENGYTDVANLAGGINAWQKNGLAVTNQTAEGSTTVKSCSGAKAASCHKGGAAAKSCAGEKAKSCAGEAPKSCNGAKKAACCAKTKTGTNTKVIESTNENEY